MTLAYSNAWLRLRDVIFNSLALEMLDVHDFALAQKNLTSKERDALIENGLELADKLCGLEFCYIERRFDDDDCEFFCVVSEGHVVSTHNSFDAAYDVAKSLNNTACEG